LGSLAFSFWIIDPANTVFVLPHPSHKNKDVARMGHPKAVGIYLPKQ
jgi:hypothetical protein